MLKILVVAFLLIEATPPQTNKQPTNGSGAPQASQPDQRGTQSHPLEANVHAIQSDKEAANEAAKDAWEKKVNRWNIGLTLAIALCALAQVIVYVRQANLLNRTLAEVHTQAGHMKSQVEEMKAQTAVAQTSADAAKLSAQALVSSDRPWVQVVITRPLEADVDQSGAAFYKIWPTIQNRGKTPAHIETILFRGHILPKDSSFPEPPTLPPEPEYIVRGQTVYSAQKGLLPPDTGIEPVPVRISANDLHAMRERAAFLYVYGQVFYRGHTGDGLISAFCFLYYVPPAIGMDHPEGFVTYSSIPEAYFEYT